MEQKNIHNLLIIDASGSMSSKVDEVTGGINQIFRDLKKEQQDDAEIKNKVTLIDFSSHNDFNVLYGSATPDELLELKQGDYQTRSMTALYDAIGKAFQLVPKNNDGVLVTIFTDGLENDSKEFNTQTIKSLIKTKEAQGWTITYFGTTEEAMMQAQSIGIKQESSLHYTDSKRGTGESFSRMAKGRKKYVTSVKSAEILTDIFDKKSGDQNSDKA